MSMIKLVDHNDIDKTRWDNLVELSPYSFPWWRSWYLDVVSPEWKAIIVDNYSFVLPLPVRKKGMINYVYPPDFTQQIGVFGTEIASPEMVTQMLEKAVESFKYLEFNLNHRNKIEFLNGTLRKRRDFELSLNDSFENLFKNFHSNTKRNIKKSEKENLSIRISNSPKQIIQTFIENKGKQLKHKKGIDFNLLEKLVVTGLKKGIVEIKEVYQNDVFLGGAIFFNEQDRKVFLFSALSSEGRKKRVMFFLLNRVIEENAKSNVILDFEGSDDKNLGDFYHRFGAEERLYLHLKINRLPKLIKWLKN
ncbi:MAG: hypothetical protein DRI54_04930 [Bacteroidetes bacterium]|nr:MAG: hypothetical protein DRI54_04930 [Bacteroidota bacterium]